MQLISSLFLPHRPIKSSAIYQKREVTYLP